MRGTGRLGSPVMLVAMVLLAGCATLADRPTAPLALTVPHFVASLRQDDLVAVDPWLCLPEPLPGPIPAWHEVPRVDGGMVPYGTQRIEMVATLGGFWTGFQLGHRLDDGGFTWSPRIDQGSVSVFVEVQPDQDEAGGPRWTFAWRAQVLDGQDCTAGAHWGSLAVVVAAHVRNQVQH